MGRTGSNLSDKAARRAEASAAVRNRQKVSLLMIIDGNAPRMRSSAASSVAIRSGAGADRPVRRGTVTSSARRTACAGAHLFVG